MKPIEITESGMSLCNWRIRLSEFGLQIRRFLQSLHGIAFLALSYLLLLPAIVWVFVSLACPDYKQCLTPPQQKFRVKRKGRLDGE